MTVVNRNERLNPEGMKVVLGIPFTRVVATGTINSSNDEFYLDGDYIPFYPAGHKDIVVKVTDITAELYKGTTYTEAAITSIEQDDDGNDAGVKLTTAPTSQTADSVKISGYAMVWARILQDITPNKSRDSDEITEVGTSDKIKTLGARTREVKYELIMTKDMLRVLTNIWTQEKTDQTGVGTGLVLREERDAPVMLKGYIPVVYNQVELQRYLLSDIEIEEDMLSAKAGETTIKLTCNMIISDPIDVLMDEDDSYL